MNNENIVRVVQPRFGKEKRILDQIFKISSADVVFSRIMQLVL